jgi:hypothetical protein
MTRKKESTPFCSLQKDLYDENKQMAVTFLYLKFADVCKFALAFQRPKFLQFKCEFDFTFASLLMPPHAKFA